MLPEKCLLCGVQFPVTTQILYGNELLAMHGGQGRDTGIDGLITDSLLVQFTDCYGTGSTITGSTSLLGAFQKQVITQIVKDTGVWVQRVNHAELTILQETDQYGFTSHLAGIAGIRDITL
jgi:hypothetical protein